MCQQYGIVDVSYGSMFLFQIFPEFFLEVPERRPAIESAGLNGCAHLFAFCIDDPVIKSFTRVQGSLCAAAVDPDIVKPEQCIEVIERGVSILIDRVFKDLGDTCFGGHLSILQSF